jgi:ABC-type oligopeptide transport system substrate-binding subunit
VWTFGHQVDQARYLRETLRRLGFRSRAQILHDFPLAGHAPPIGVTGWAADSPEPAGFLRSLIACGNRANLSGFCDRRIDAAITRAQAEGAAAGADWQRIERRIARAAPVLPLANPREVVIASPRAGNLQFHPLMGLMLDRVWVR